ncbi:MAG: SusD/RagB family nutrient-binding outer membrane lipoprotein, partial [Tannerellaceae bacterium]|nr:SusD/RagB family nutrient-binding outer membrane lipoprotein [Tannerellaceae bacterium]
WEGYAEGQFGTFYGCMADYVKLLDEYEKSEMNKAAYEAAKLAAMVHLYDWLLACVDMYGDMPFSEACRLPLTSDVTDSHSTYDKAEDIYATAMDELKEAAQRFTGSDLVNFSSFAAQDYVCNGNFGKWARYANSLRLRAAIRVSQHGSLTAKGKETIAEILGNPAQYPLVETNDDNIFLRNDHSGDLNFEGGGGFDWVSCRLASGAIVSRMLKNGNYYVGAPATAGKYEESTDDPRILLLFTMRAEGDIDDPVSDPAQVYTYANVLAGETRPLYFYGATLDREIPPYVSSPFSEIVYDGFFRRNRNFEHVQMTASEVLFCKAEAYHRGWGVAQNDAEAERYFKEAVKQSIKLYYHWNEVSDKTTTQSIPTPSDAAIEAFAAARWVSSVNPEFPYDAADPKLDAILTQKWLHWGIFFPRQCWSQIRRTGLPKLIYPGSGDQVLPWAPDRWRYPVAERSYNQKYPGEDVDTYYNILFWADPRGMRHSVKSGSTWTDQY